MRLAVLEVCREKCRGVECVMVAVTSLGVLFALPKQMRSSAVSLLFRDIVTFLYCMVHVGL